MWRDGVAHLSYAQLRPHSRVPSEQEKGVRCERERKREESARRRETRDTGGEGTEGAREKERDNARDARRGVGAKMPQMLKEPLQVRQIESDSHPFSFPCLPAFPLVAM